MHICETLLSKDHGSKSLAFSRYFDSYVFSGSNYNSNIQHLPKNKISTRLENFLNKKLNEPGSQSESESYHLNEAYSTKLGLISLRA